MNRFAGSEPVPNRAGFEYQFAGSLAYRRTANCEPVRCDVGEPPSSLRPGSETRLSVEFDTRGAGIARAEVQPCDADYQSSAATVLLNGSAAHAPPGSSDAAALHAAPATISPPASVPAPRKAPRGRPTTLPRAIHAMAVGCSVVGREKGACAPEGVSREW